VVSLSGTGQAQVSSLTKARWSPVLTRLHWLRLQMNNLISAASEEDLHYLIPVPVILPGTLYVRLHIPYKSSSLMVLFYILRNWNSV